MNSRLERKASKNFKTSLNGLPQKMEEIQIFRNHGSDEKPGHSYWSSELITISFSDNEI